MSVNIPLISHATADTVFAYRNGQPILAKQFLHDVHLLAKQLPQRHYILNLCSDRYHFAVGFAAALVQAQISLLPPNYTQGFVTRLQQDYPDMYCLVDGQTELHDIQILQYPHALKSNPVQHEIPSIPSQQIAALVFTSGSTGQAIPHPKSWNSLCRGASAAAICLNITSDSGMAVLGTVPTQHMYGLESCLMMVMRNGLSLIAERPFFPADIAARLSELPEPRCLITTPIHLRSIVQDETTLPALSFALSATAHLPHQLALDAENKLAAPLFEIYGCTEAGMVAYRRPAMITAWQLLPNLSLDKDEAGFKVNGGHVEIAAPISDIIELQTDGSFILLGRTADLINIAGKRTSLANLNLILNEIDGVVDGVFFMPDDNDGSVKRPLAFVVAPHLDKEAILQALRLAVDAVFLPRPLYFVETITRNSTGKITRDSLLQLLANCEKNAKTNP
jgi:acyl-coenzyme A synthetase/AMP-(fatty) acid ligase